MGVFMNNIFYDDPPPAPPRESIAYKPGISTVFSPKIEMLFAKHIELFIDEFFNELRFFDSQAAVDIVSARLYGADII